MLWLNSKSANYQAGKRTQVQHKNNTNTRKWNSKQIK